MTLGFKQIMLFTQDSQNYILLSLHVSFIPLRVENLNYKIIHTCSRCLIIMLAHLYKSAALVYKCCKNCNQVCPSSELASHLIPFEASCFVVTFLDCRPPQSTWMLILADHQSPRLPEAFSHCCPYAESCLHCLPGSVASGSDKIQAQLAWPVPAQRQQLMLC